jgi:hypothetical protein
VGRREGGREGTNDVTRPVIRNTERNEDVVVQEPVVQSESVTVGGVVVCAQESIVSLRKGRERKRGRTSHRNGENRIGLVRSAVDQRTGDGEVLVGRGDVPGDDVADVVEVGLRSITAFSISSVSPTGEEGEESEERDAQGGDT